MGGGTGTGGAPIVAEVARELNILTVAVVTKPFPFEGKKRLKNAQEGIKELAQNVDSLITIPNEKLLSIMGEDTPLLEAFGAVDDVLLGAVQGIADLIVRPGKINVDFADVRTVMLEMGMAMMGSGTAEGESRARDAAETAIRSRLLDEVDIHGARGILVNIAAGVDISLGEFTEVGATIEEYASDNATVVIGTVIDPEMTDEIRVTVVATGLGIADMDNGRKSVDKTQKILAGDGTVDYTEFDKPTLMRNRKMGEGKDEAQAQVGKSDMEYLDIPAFLRRQAD
jgi:cell division protein FtsZ